MEDERNVQISEQGFYPGTSPEGKFLQQTFIQYLTFSESLFNSFFTGQNIEVQNRILINNFGLKQEQIDSWTARAARYQMTPQSFSFFLHVAFYSARNAFRQSTLEARQFTNDLVATLSKTRDQLEKKSSEEKKSTYSKKAIRKDKKKKKRQLDSDDDIDYSMESDELMRMVDNDEISDEEFERQDRNLHINRLIDLKKRPIAETSGSTSNVDLPNKESLSTQPITQMNIDDTIPQMSSLSIKDKINLTKASNKNIKSKKQSIQNVITGHKPTDEDTSKVRDILVYDIPISWTAEQILQQLSLWGKVISLQTKPQRKYQTLRLKIELSTFRLAQFEVNEDPSWTTDLGGIPVRWFPARWNLKERKQREKFQATIRKIPESMTLATLWTDQRPHQFLTAIKGLKSFKIIQTARGDRKLIGYFEKWVDMRRALVDQFTWENEKLSWNRHDPPKQQTRSRDNNVNKNQQRTSRSHQADKNQKNSKKNSTKKPLEMKSDKPKKKQKKDKSRKASRSKVLADILDALRKLI